MENKQSPVRWFLDQTIVLGFIESREDLLLQERYLSALRMEEQRMGIFLNWFMTRYSTTIIEDEFTFVDRMGNPITVFEILDEYNKTN